MNNQGRKSQHRYEEDDDDTLHGLKAPRRDDDDVKEKTHKPTKMVGTATESINNLQLGSPCHIGKETDDHNPGNEVQDIVTSITKDSTSNNEKIEKAKTCESQQQQQQTKTTSSSQKRHKLELAPGSYDDDEDIVDGWDEEGLLVGQNNDKESDRQMTSRQARMLLHPDELSDDEESEESEDDRPGAIPVRGMGRSGLGATLDEEEATILYSMGGGSNRCNNDDITLSRRNHDDNPPNNYQEEHLVEAHLAPEPPKQPQIVEGTPINKIKTQHYVFMIFLVVTFGIALAIGLGVGLKHRDASNANENIIIVNVTESPTESLVPEAPSTVNSGTTFVPTTSLLPTTSAPTLSPSSSSSSSTSTMDLAISIISEYIPTLETNPSNIQLQALEWLVENDGEEGLFTTLSISTEDHNTIGRLLDRYVLAIFYYSTNGDDWTQNDLWLSQESVCTWYSSGSQVTMCSIGVENGRVDRIYLDDENLRGEIPTEIGLLTSLSQLYLRYNYLGTIPTEIGMLTELTNLSFLNCYIDGTIPTELGLLTSLTRLNFGNNNLHDPIPTDLFSLPYLSYLQLSANAHRVLPTEIGLLTSLRWLYLYDNNFQGALPTEIGMLTALQIMTLSLSITLVRKYQLKLEILWT